MSVYQDVPLREWWQLEQHHEPRSTYEEYFCHYTVEHPNHWDRCVPNRDAYEGWNVFLVLGMIGGFLLTRAYQFVERKTNEYQDRLKRAQRCVRPGQEMP